MSTSETGSRTVAPNVEASDLEGIIDRWLPPPREGSLFIDSTCRGNQLCHEKYLNLFIYLHVCWMDLKPRV
jgi:hypothetical protein